MAKTVFLAAGGFNCKLLPPIFSSYGHLEQEQFRKKLILQLVNNIRNPDRNKKQGRPSTSDTEERLQKSPHFIYLQEKSTSKDCAFSSNRKVPGGRKETKFFCKPARGSQDSTLDFVSSDTLPFENTSFFKFKWLLTFSIVFLCISCP